MKSLITGHILLIICCIFYLIWWCIAFRPGFTGSRVTERNGILLLITAAAGFAGVAFSVSGINHPGDMKLLIPSAAIVIGGIILYVFLLLISSSLLHRRVTTELILIVGWLTLELLSYQRAYCGGYISRVVTIFFFVLAAAASVSGLFLYLQYYRVSESKGYGYGMIPLITDAVCMAAFLLACRVPVS